MTKLNKNYEKLVENYLFVDMANRAARFKEQNPGKKVISMGIGDVTLPLCPAVVKALSEAAAEMGAGETFRGYPRCRV